MTIITERELLIQAKDALIDLMSGGTRYIDREGNITIEFDYIEAQQVEIERLRTLLICVEVNLSKSMSKSIQRLQARTIREVLSETP